MTYRLYYQTKGMTMNIPGAFEDEQEAEALAEDLNTSWKDSGARGILVQRFGWEDNDDVRFVAADNIGSALVALEMQGMVNKG